MIVKRVPLYVCFMALEHFSKCSKDARHGFVHVDDRAVEFSGVAAECKVCRNLMDEIDVSSVFA